MNYTAEVIHKDYLVIEKADVIWVKAKNHSPMEFIIANETNQHPDISDLKVGDTVKITIEKTTS